MPTADPFGLEPDSLLPASAVHVVEAALFDAAIGGVAWREIPLQGELVRAEQYRPPDVAAAKALLAARMPERYGADPVVVNNIVHLITKVERTIVRPQLASAHPTDTDR